MLGQSIVNPKVIGTTADIVRLVREQRVNRIIVGLADRRGKMPIEELLEAKLQGVRIEEPETTYERLTGKIMLGELKPSWLIFSDGFRARKLTRAAKRVVDVVLSIVGMVLAAPLMALTAIAVRLDTPGPVVYAQERVGEHGRTFMVYKFRSMRTDAERGGTPIWARDQDDRITRVGRIIRHDAPRRNPAALERAARRHELRGSPPRAAVLRGTAGRGHPVLPPAACGEARRDRVGAGAVPLRRINRGRAGEAALRPLLHQAHVHHLRPDDRLRHGQGDSPPEGRAVSTPQDARTWGTDDRQLTLVARNVSTRYLAIATDGAIGLMLMPFNVAHLGQSAYGLWALTTSITMYFSVLDFGYGGALVKFVAQYRARRDRQALNEILSTMFVLLTGVGLVHVSS